MPTSQLDYLGISELATFFSVSRQRVIQLVAKDNFPAPFFRVAAGPVWKRAAIETWAKANRKKVR